MKILSMFGIGLETKRRKTMAAAAAWVSARNELLSPILVE